MLDYTKTREDALRRRQELTIRQQQIVKQKQQLEEESAQIKRELIGLEQILEGLDFMSNDTPPDLEEVGFTDQIRRILGTTSSYLVPTQIRDALQQAGVTGSSPKNLLISVHTVLNRIQDELETTQTAEGKTAYRGKPSGRNAYLRGSLARSIAMAGIAPPKETKGKYGGPPVEIDSYTLGTGVKITGTALAGIPDEKDEKD